MVYIPDKLASSLSDSLIGSLTMGSNEDKDGDYDFSVLGWTLQDFNNKKKIVNNVYTLFVVVVYKSHCIL